jgi:predicted phage terminase large subunit-like protein
MFHTLKGPKVLPNPASAWFGGEFARFGNAKRASSPRPDKRRRDYLGWLKSNSDPSFDFTAPHIVKIASTIDEVTGGTLDRVRIHMPPRHGKTATVTVMYPVYLLLRDPTLRILVTCHTAKFARRLGRRIRNLAARLGVNIAADKKAADEFATDEGGLVLCCGVGSPPTGEGFQYIIIDDPIKSRKEADSIAFRDTLDDWYTDEIYTRLEPGGRIVGIWTLWHEDDLAGRLDAREKSGDADADKWHVLKLAAIAGPNDPLGRDEGAALWTLRYPIEALRRIRSNMARRDGLRGWEALYQQNPTPLSGDMFNVGEFRIVDRAPVGLAWVRAWDVAATRGGGDATASVLMGEDKSTAIFYIRDVTRSKVDTGERDTLIVETANDDGIEVVQVLPADPGAAGKAQVKYWGRMLAGFVVRFARPVGSKTARAESYSAQVNLGNFALVRGPWNAEFIEEHRQFPNGGHDDQVDAASDAFREIVGNAKRKTRVY